MKKKIIVGNWKMNPTTYTEAKKIANSIKKYSKNLEKTQVVICPPSIYSKSLIPKENTSNFSVGIQNTNEFESGAYTGEISALMIKDIGATHVIIGHSERRIMGENDESISKKVLAVLNQGMNAILCIGEKNRDEQGEYLNFLKLQIKSSLNNVSAKNISKLIIAYEPIWAIGAKEAMTPENIREMSIFIKKILSDMYGHDEAISTPILYGGSVNFRNASDIITKGQVDGLLVGRESVNISGFNELLKTVENI